MLFSLALAFSGAPTKDAVHPERVAQIAHLDKHATWKAAAHPRFAADAPGASSSLMGVKGNWVEDLREAVRQGEVEEYAPHPDTLAVAVPDSFDSATNWPSCGKTLNDVRDQSNCGCCWAFGGAEAASDRMCIATKGKLQMPLSANDVCFNAGGFLSSGCNGGQISTLTLPLTLTLTTPPSPSPLITHHSTFTLTTHPNPHPHPHPNPSQVARSRRRGPTSSRAASSPAVCHAGLEPRTDLTCHSRARPSPWVGNYNGTGPFGGGWCSAFPLPHCHHHGPQVRAGLEEEYLGSGTTGAKGNSLYLLPLVLHVLATLSTPCTCYP
jgi:hypothetical protein